MPKERFDCINFDEHFSTHLTAWIDKNAAKYKNNMDRMEEKMPEVYMRWSNAPAGWLGGIAPALYFAQFADADHLVRWMCAYHAQKIPVPDLLLERITTLGDPAAERLNTLLTDPGAPYEAVLTAISLLREMGSALPMALYVSTVASCAKATEQTDMAIESLREMGAEAARAILEALPLATDAAETVFLDVLCDYPLDERVYELAMRKFASRGDNTALYASYLCKLGDPRAIPALIEAADSDSINYLDFVEIANAIESLGGDAPPMRDFTGDPYYESLKNL